MKRILRPLSLAVALALLAACGEDAPPDPKIPPSAPVPKPPVVKPATPVLPPASPESSKPPAKPGAPRTPKPETQPPAKDRPTPKTPGFEPRTAPARVDSTAGLDLSLPRELVETLSPEESLPDSKPLLPELFAPKPAVQGPYQLSGKLLTNDQSDDYWQSVEGAQLQIEIRN
ncbi:hypothetical protein [Zestomonas carbonaria]|nr:hypothetical protein [Pseudomonas carbonaria]